MKKFVIFGVSAFLSDIFDLIHASGGKVHKIYLNMPEVKKERQLGAKERVSLLGYHVDIYDSLASFEPEGGRHAGSCGFSFPDVHRAARERLCFSCV